jgi:hypothetical protein
MATIETANTIHDIIRVNNHCGCVRNDRGNGSAGPLWIEAYDSDECGELVTEVTREEDPGAWRLAMEAHIAFDLGTGPTRVWVGEKALGDNGCQAIYSI